MKVYRFVFFRNPLVKTFNNPGKVTVTRKGDNTHLSNETNRGWLDFIRDRYGGSIVSHYKDPYQPAHQFFFFVAHLISFNLRISYFCERWDE